MSTHLRPNLGYRNAPAAIRFLEEAFGFEPVAIYEDDYLARVRTALDWA